MKSSNRNGAIAVIGMSCRFAQINNLEDFWQVLSEGKSVIEKIPNTRWNHNDFYDPDKDAPWKTNQDSGALLKDINHFDPFFFHISPKEAIEMSPSQKLMMELAWESFENSSLKHKNFYGSKTGVYIGNIWADFEHLRKLRKSEINNFSAIGQSSNVIANRISYHFGLTGPSLVLDTGCSSSLVALMLAVQSLRDGSSNMCLAGGVNHIIDPEEYVYLAKFGGLSSKGQCSAFDADADGFVRGEGAGLVLLKRLEDAERDNDKIIGIIRGGAVTNNGFNVNMPATSKDGQVEVLTQAYKDASVLPADVDYIEAHGTGTKQGDPTETGALGEFFGQGRPDDSTLLIGSVKTNLGHCESSSGIGGVIKTLLALQHQTIPKNLNFNSPNPKIDFQKLKLKVPTENTFISKPNKQTIKAGVSSYGWGGTNVHMVFEEYQQAEEVNKSVDKSDYFFLPLSAHSPKALVEYSKKYQQYLVNEDSNAVLLDICASSAHRKTDFEYKKMFFGKSSKDLIHHLESFQNQDVKSLKSSKNNQGKVVFVFPGQGAQWLSMGKVLYEKEPVFKKNIDDCESAFKKYVDWSLVQEIYADEASSNLKRINVIQPYLFAMQVALSKLWMSKGVVADAVTGHSMGEVAAAYIAGALTIDDAANIICSRSILMNTLSGKGGAMAVTELDVNQAQEMVKKYNDKVSLAVQNSPKSTVLAGDNAIIQEIIDDLNEKNLFCRQVKVDVASHSPQMDLIKDDLFKQVSNVLPLKNNIPIYSTVLNKKVEGETMNAEYWRNNLRGTVQFSSVTEQLLNDGYNTFIEVSPHTVLSTAIAECAEFFNHNNTFVIGSLHRDNPSMDEFSKNFGLLYETGYKIDWDKYFNGYSPKNVSLPSYPFQRENYEIKDLSSHFENGSDNISAHPLIGSMIKLAESDAYYWESKLSLYNLPYLSHHQVNENAVFPGGFYMEMILAAIKEINEPDKYQVNNIKFVNSIELHENEPVNIQLKIESDNGTLSQFKVFKKAVADNKWEITCSGLLKKDDKALNERIDYPVKSQSSLNKTQIYSSFKNIGVTFKEYFQNVEEIKVEDEHVYATIHLKDHNFYKLEQFTVPPILLDNCLHSLFAEVLTSVDGDTIKSTFVQGIEQFKISSTAEFNGQYFVKAKLKPLSHNEDEKNYSILGNISVYDGNSNQILELNNVSAKVIDTGIKNTVSDNEQQKDLREIVLNESDDKARIEILSDYMLNLVAEASKASVDQLELSMTFKNMGIDSLTIVQLRNIVEKQLDIKLSVKMFYEFPSIDLFSEMLNELIKADGELISKDIKTDVQSWLVESGGNSEVTKQLFLFHDAGGSIRLFEDWESFIDSSVELISIQLPGRDGRTEESLSNDLQQILNELLPLMNEKITKPFFVYGHSMGGLLAFEATRQLQNKYNKTAEQLIISGTPSLKNYNNVFVNQIFEQNYTDEQWLSLLTSGNETSLSLDNELVNDLLRTLQNDFELIHAYKYQELPMLKCSITAIHAESDDRVNIDDVKRWDAETECSFELIEVKGGHNFVYDSPDIAPDLVNSILVKHLVSVER